MEGIWWTPSLVFWLWAWFNMAVVVVLAIEGVRRIRRGFRSTHRALMLTAGSFVALFLLAYVAKVLLLGKETLVTWSDDAILMLRIHETCVTLMLLAGATAGILAWRRPQLFAGDGPRVTSRARWVHRIAGRTAVYAGVLGLLTAGLLLIQLSTPANIAGMTEAVASAPPFDE